MANEYVSGTVGREMGSVPFGEMISKVALGIAEGQMALDKSSMTVAEFMSGQKILYNEQNEKIDMDGNLLPEDAPPAFHDSRIYFGYDFQFSGSIASAVATLEPATAPATGFVISVADSDIQGGSEYDFAPDVEIIGDGTGATATATVANGIVTGVAIINQGTGYTNASIVFSGGKVPKRVPRLVSMLELGFAPNFYQFVETVIEIKITVNMTETKEKKKGETPRIQTTRTNSSHAHSRARVYYNPYRGYSYGGSYSRSRYSRVAQTRTVDPAMASKYNYSIEGSSSVRTKLVPIPPPAILEERVRTLMELDEEYQSLVIKRLGDEA